MALMAALRCLRSAIALSVAVFFIQRVNKHRSQQTAAGIPPAPHGALAAMVAKHFQEYVSLRSLEPQWLRMMMMVMMNMR